MDEWMKYFESRIEGLEQCLFLLKIQIEIDRELHEMEIDRLVKRICRSNQPVLN